MLHRLYYKLMKGCEDDLWDDGYDAEAEYKESIEDVVAVHPGNPFKTILVRDTNGKYRIIDLFTRLEVSRARKKRNKLVKQNENVE